VGVTLYEKDVTTTRKGHGNNGAAHFPPILVFGASMPTVSLDNLRDCLTLAVTGPGTYTGANLALDYHRVFGGQILGQTLLAATAAGDGKQVKSLTQLFPR
jgi:hypothetical protein